MQAHEIRIIVLMIYIIKIFGHFEISSCLLTLHDTFIPFFQHIVARYSVCSFVGIIFLNYLNMAVCFKLKRLKKNGLVFF